MLVSIGWHVGHMLTGRLRQLKSVVRRRLRDIYPALVRAGHFEHTGI
jgi:hypothetical protein